MRSQVFHPLALMITLATALGAHAEDGHAPPREPTAEALDTAAWHAFESGHFRLEADGNISCYSTDGRNCSSETPGQQPARPATCGAAYEEFWRTTGYDQPGHWCNRAYANLFAKWRNYDALGFSTLMALNPGGHMMCVTTPDGDCRRDDKRQAPSPGETIDPLVCGPALRARSNVTGYEANQPHHWCKAPVIVAQLDSPLLIGPSRLADGTYDVVRGVRFNVPRWLLNPRKQPVFALVGHRAGAIQQLQSRNGGSAQRHWIAGDDHYLQATDEQQPRVHRENANTVFSYSDDVVGVGKAVSVLHRGVPSGGWSVAKNQVLLTLMDTASFQTEDAPRVTGLVIAHPRQLPAERSLRRTVRELVGDDAR